MVFIISSLTRFASGEVAVRTARTKNPAKAYSIAKHYVAGNLPSVITLWVEVGDTYMLPYNYIITSEETLADTFNRIPRDISIAEAVKERRTS